VGKFPIKTKAEDSLYGTNSKYYKQILVENQNGTEKKHSLLDQRGRTSFIDLLKSLPIFVFWS
jgi:hypothetical protein